MSSVWTDEFKAKVVQMYKDANPTAETSLEVVKEIAEKIDQSPNGVRQVLVQAGVYIKREAPATSSTSKTSDSDSKPKRSSKEDSYNALREAIKAKGLEPDEEIITKLTGKAAAYLAEVMVK